MVHNDIISTYIEEYNLNLNNSITVKILIETYNHSLYVGVTTEECGRKGNIELRKHVVTM